MDEWGSTPGLPDEAYEHDGLITMLDGRAIPTLRGRLLNDTIITELLETLD